jgi:hypothetical protein
MLATCFSSDMTPALLLASPTSSAHAAGCQISLVLAGESCFVRRAPASACLASDLSRAASISGFEAATKEEWIESYRALR